MDLHKDTVKGYIVAVVHSVLSFPANKLAISLNRSIGLRMRHFVDHRGCRVFGVTLHLHCAIAAEKGLCRH